MAFSLIQKKWVQQGVTLMGRNTTGPQSRATPGELRCIWAAVDRYRRRQTPESISLAILHYV